MNHRWKRWTLPFKTFFHSSRYNFRLPRYRRVKKRVIFNRLPSLSLSLTRTSRSHLLSLTYPKFQTSDRRDSWKSTVNVKVSRKNKVHSWISSHRLKREILILYLSNRLRYRDKTKSDFNGMSIPIFWANYNVKFLLFSRVFFIWKVKIYKLLLIWMVCYYDIKYIGK